MRILGGNLSCSRQIAEIIDAHLHTNLQSTMPAGGPEDILKLWSESVNRDDWNEKTTRMAEWADREELKAIKKSSVLIHAAAIQVFADHGEGEEA